MVTLRGANGYSVTGQAILDYSGTYPQPYDATTSRRGVYGQTTAHLSNLLDLSGGARLEHEDGSTVFAGGAPVRNDPHQRRRVWRGSHDAPSGVHQRGPCLRSQRGVQVRGHTEGLGCSVPARPLADGDDWRHEADAQCRHRHQGAEHRAGAVVAVHAGPDVRSQAAVPGLRRLGPNAIGASTLASSRGFWGGRARVRASFFDNQFSDLIEYVSKSVLPSSEYRQLADRRASSAPTSTRRRTTRVDWKHRPKPSSGRWSASSVRIPTCTRSSRSRSRAAHWRRRSTRRSPTFRSAPTVPWLAPRRSGVRPIWAACCLR